MNMPPRAIPPKARIVLEVDKLSPSSETESQEQEPYPSDYRARREAEDGVDGGYDSDEFQDSGDYQSRAYVP